MYDYQKIRETSRKIMATGEYEFDGHTITLPAYSRDANEYIDHAIQPIAEQEDDIGEVYDTHSFIAVLRHPKNEGKTLIINTVWKKEYKTKMYLICTLSKAVNASEAKDYILKGNHYGILSKDVCFFRSMEYILLKHPVKTDVLTVKQPEGVDEYLALLDTAAFYGYGNIIFPMRPDVNPELVKWSFLHAKPKSSFTGDVYVSCFSTAHLMTAPDAKPTPPPPPEPVSWFTRFKRRILKNA